FGVSILGKIHEVAFRSNGIRFTNQFGWILPHNTPVIPMDNTAQGIETIGDIIREISKQQNVPIKEILYVNLYRICPDMFPCRIEAEVFDSEKDANNPMMMRRTFDQKIAHRIDNRSYPIELDV